MSTADGGGWGRVRRAAGDAIRLGSLVKSAAVSNSPLKRHSARQALLARLADAWDLEAYGANLLWLEDEAFWARYQPFFERRQASAPDRKYVLMSLARSIRNLPGDTVECGSFFGAGSSFICYGSTGAGAPADRLHHVFDSFEGLSMPTSSDTATSKRMTGWKGWAQGDFAASQEAVAQNLSDFPHVRFHKGWIPTRFHEVEDRSFAFVHVDVDLYQPTHDALSFFYPRLVAGGVLVCDDYGFLTCPGATRAFDELAATWPEAVVTHLPTGQGLLVKR